MALGAKKSTVKKRSQNDGRTRPGCGLPAMMKLRRGTQRKKGMTTSRYAERLVPNGAISFSNLLYVRGGIHNSPYILSSYPSDGSANLLTLLFNPL